MNSVQILDRNELYGIIWVEDYFVHVGSTLINLLVKVKLLASYITDFVRTDTQSVTWTCSHVTVPNFFTTTFPYPFTN